MRCYRLYAGESHFEKTEVAFAPMQYAPPAGWDSEFEGAAGDAVLMEDTTGKGHSASVKGEDDVYGLMVHLD